ncbi:SacI homology domain-containing protein [Xylariales sp. PMI_506]|nr:SacI homology domain-containing protein [Xylariales sp. PMI_506]
MPISLARKLLICAAVDGLVIQPLATKGQRPAQPVKIKYGDATLSSISRDQLPDVSSPNSSFEAFGVVGTCTIHNLSNRYVIIPDVISRLSYLVTITGRELIAHIRGYPVYVVTDVALTPCTSQDEALSAIRHTSVQLRRAATTASDKKSGEETGTDSDTESLLAHEDIDEVQSDHVTGSGGNDGRSSIAEDVIKRKGSYGRFAQRWFSRRGWVQDQKRNMGISNTASQTQDGPADSQGKKQESQKKKLSDTVIAETSTQGITTAVSTGESLLPKFLRMAHIWFGTSKSFYFSYDVDITRNLGGNGLCPPPAEVPLHRSVDPLFFWNKHLLEPFSAANEEALLLPLMQGFVGQREFIVDRYPPQVDSINAPESVELDTWTPPQAGSGASSPAPEPLKKVELRPLRPSEKKFLITVISRRSIKRAGLRYLRRGIDEEGYPANGVETEQILSSPLWTDSNISSFVQVRGSIPLFFTQSPYSLKPVPELQHSDAANLKAFSRHFDQMRKRYGKVQIVNLVEKHGVESALGEAFERNVTEYNQGLGENPEKLEFEWFDFHAACRGMKFENVSLLLDILGPEIEKLGSTVEKPAVTLDNNSLASTQKGILRTNCMDCLDRTNVCQSSFGKFMLDLQLKNEGFDMSAQLDQTTSWFNTLWADNGDAISKQYASTAAMKGDYTRTRKRDYRGMVNDLGLSLTRFYNGMVNDYFSQAAIDFLLGNVTSLVFEEFESEMMTKDLAVSVSKMREQAIETSQKIVVENEGEDFIGGWIVLSPHQSDTIKSLPFEEVVLLLTDVALYSCRFDWKLDKVSSFERVDLAHIVGIKVGTYITSTMSSTQADETKNIGLVVTYEPGKNDIKRVNTRSLTSHVSSSNSSDGNKDEPQSGPAQAETTQTHPASANTPPQAAKKIAFKALYAHSSINDASVSTKATGAKVLTEQEQIDVIANEIERLVLASQPPPPAVADEPPHLIEHGDIISLAEAKRNTGLLETLGHSIKKLVWA